MPIFRETKGACVLLFNRPPTPGSSLADSFFFFSSRFCFVLATNRVLTHATIPVLQPKPLLATAGGL